MTDLTDESAYVREGLTPAERMDLLHVLGRAPGALAIIRPTDLSVLYANAAFRGLVPDTAARPSLWLEEPGPAAVLRQALDAGAPFLSVPVRNGHALDVQIARGRGIAPASTELIVLSGFPVESPDIETLPHGAFRKAAEAMPCPVFTARGDGAWDHCNGHFAKTFGAPERAHGWTWLDLIGESDRDGVESSWRATVLLSTPWRRRFQMRTAAGTHAPVLANAHPVFDPFRRQIRWHGVLLVDAGIGD